MSSQTLELFPELLWLYGTGILPAQGFDRLIGLREIIASVPITEGQIQPASLDLRLGPVAYRVRASFLSSDCPVSEKLKRFVMYELDLTQPQVLERDCAYIVPMIEELNLSSDISGRANPKSSTGRIDVFTRLITDFGGEFEGVRAGYKGKLYTEIVPQTFSIRVRQGDRLNQLRLRRGTPRPTMTDLEKLHEDERSLNSEEESPAQELYLDKEKKVRWLHIDLTGDERSEVIGYRAKRHAPIIDVSQVGCYDPADYWETILCNSDKSLLLEPGEFYILASKEPVRIPPTHAAEMEPYDPSRGEFRIHYAGFFDPGFGYGTDDPRGTPAVLEVRSHEVPFLLEDGQIVAALKYHRLVSPPNKIYGQGIGSSYQHQRLALSKHFRRG
jgi:dCTP deaminase